ncbi:hypothetical protein [Streptomyces sp. CC210A]|uniref:hypothetical protein n=1 Tax=Streptomyces sp. CC210A TaxID=2898184 RepID=UPI001F3A656D|nr:hypothetical protein [Streptomyces sp. CC210A]
MTYAEVLQAESDAWLASHRADPTDDCDECSRLARAQRAAEAAGDHSRASDCVVLLRRHPDHGRRPTGSAPVGAG